MEHLYTAWILRFVPNSARGEFINMGVLVGRDGGDWALRHVETLERATCLSTFRPEASELLSPVTGLADTVNGLRPADEPFSELVERASVAGVRRIKSGLHNALQLSNEMPAIGDTADDVAQLLYQHLVLEGPARERASARDRMRARLQEAVQDAVGARGAVKTRQKVVVSDIELDQRFDMTLQRTHGAHSPVMLAHCFSFQGAQNPLKTQVQSWSFFVTQLRSRGAVLMTGEGVARQSLRVDPEIPIRVLHDKPVGESQTDLLRGLSKAWRDNNVEAYETDEIEGIVSDSRRIITA